MTKYWLQQPEPLQSPPERMEGYIITWYIETVQHSLLTMLTAYGIAVWRDEQEHLLVGIPEGSRFYEGIGLDGYVVKIKGTMFILTHKTISHLALTQVV